MNKSNKKNKKINANKEYKKNKNNNQIMFKKIKLSNKSPNKNQELIKHRN